MEAGDVAVEPEFGHVGVGEDLRPAREAPRVRDERTRPQGLDQGGVAPAVVDSGAGERADEVLAAAQGVLQVVEHAGQRGQLRRLATVEAAHRIGCRASALRHVHASPRPSS